MPYDSTTTTSGTTSSNGSSSTTTTTTTTTTGGLTPQNMWANRPLYCSPDMVRADLPIDLPAGAFDDSDINRRIALQSGYIDDYLAGEYVVPFAAFPSTPASITLACVYLVMHFSYTVAGVPTEKEDPRQSLWGRAHDILDKIRSRTLTLTDMDGNPLTNPARSTLPEGIGPSNGIASLRNQYLNLGPMGGAVGYYGYGQFVEWQGGYPTAGPEGEERP